jgi:hypothetical protein
VKIDNTIVAGNSADVSYLDVSGAMTSQGYNLIGDDTGSTGLVNGMNHDQVGSSANPLVPMLGPLQDNAEGQAPFTMALLPDSLALNLGDPAQLGQPDERGVVRAGGVNIGAYQASASAFGFNVQAQVTTGVPFDVTVTAEDKFGQTAIGYTGTISISNSDTDPQATPPFSYTFLPGDNGLHTFAGGVTLYTLGTQTITATDQTNGFSGSDTITVIPAVAKFILSALPSATAGSPFDIKVTAMDTNGNTVTTYTGTVTFSSTDTYRRRQGRQGIRAGSSLKRMPACPDTFSGSITLVTVGTQTFTVTDTVSCVSNNFTITVDPDP